MVAVPIADNATMRTLTRVRRRRGVARRRGIDLELRGPIDSLHTDLSTLKGDDDE